MCASRPWLRQLAPAGRERKRAQGVAPRTNLVGSAVGGRRRAVWCLRGRRRGGDIWAAGL